MATTELLRRMRGWLGGPERQRRRLEALFDEQTRALAAGLPDAEQHPFPLGPDAAEESYFVERRHRRIHPDEFRHGGCTLADCEQEFLRMWQAEGAPHLAALAPELARIARALHEVGTDEGDISEFVYVMY